MKNNNQIPYPISENDCIEKIAVILALTSSREEEEQFKNMFTEQGYSCVVTGASGLDHDLRKKIVNSTIGACLNSQLIEKDPKQVHALVHATVEACYSIKMDVSLCQSFQLKIAVVKKHDWIAVAIYGDMAIHMLTNHKTIGLGVMHF
ncbi:hut operon positive regulatory protein [Proteiniborus ethanoligenes]|uniref:Hut operon positive regulatory protein n=1 Tax=Proteiniborus ethanoligenes TaxID=415015 RepID=A0A1H3SHB3_9FIRM|nr:HutP family protein [Proteiniborus ethanoligenes]SDZ36499.1 hut operon positive regulatory protein [Proteiniborus ethanoligenes]